MKPAPPIIATVLRSGGEYTPEHVQKLRHAVATNLHRPHRFMCLSDMEVPGIQVIPFAHDWPKWWGKIELFRPGIFSGPMIYFDLDTWITHSLDEICAYDGPFAMLDDFFHPHLAASGMMMWTPSERTETIYEAFQADAPRLMRPYEGTGDQAFIRSVIPGAKRIQSLFPGKVVSWKVHCAESGIPKEAAVVCFHGVPRPWEVQAETSLAHTTSYGQWLLALEEEAVEATETQRIDEVIALSWVDVGPGKELAIEVAQEIFDEIGETKTGLWVATYPRDRKAA